MALLFRAIARCGSCRRFSSVTPASTSTCMVTTPIFYVNGPPHIGHLYSVVLADAITRWHTMRRQPTFFVTGTDEHGLKVQDSAKRLKLAYLDYCNNISDSFRTLFGQANISYHDYIRTTQPRHHVAVQAFWRQLQERGYLYLGEHSGWYCKADEAFVPQSQVITIRNQRGEEVKVMEGSQHPVEWVSENNYKFKLSLFQDRLLAWLHNSPDVIVPHSRRQEILSQLEQHELQDLSVSRLRSKIEWGIPVPDDPQHTIYVWIDALVNYLTVLGYPQSLTPPGAWPASYQILGKDIARFHTVYWPALLMAVGLPPPKQLVIHAHFLVNGTKMSKSLGNVVDPVELLSVYGVDAVRYFLLRHGSLSYDTDFCGELLVRHFNNEVVNTMGNLLSRTLAPNLWVGVPGVEVGGMPAALQWDEEQVQLVDRAILTRLQALPDEVAHCYSRLDFSAALVHIKEVLWEVNKYFNDQEPWKLQSQPNRLHTVSYLSVEAVRQSALLLQPIIPSAIDRFCEWFGVPPHQRSLEHARFGATSSPATPSTPSILPVPSSSFIMFPRIKTPKSPPKAQNKSKGSK